MSKGKKVFTSISISQNRQKKFEECIAKFEITDSELLSVLCYKAGVSISKKIKYLQSVEYQERGGDYSSKAVHFYVADHEFIHSHRLACKVSVSHLLALAIDLFLDEIMENGINPIEIAYLRVFQNSYKEKSHYIRNLTFSITKNNQFEEYIMKIRYNKT